MYSGYIYSLTALSACACIGQVAMAEGLPLGVTSSFEEDCCVTYCKLVFENDRKGYNEPCIGLSEENVDI